MKRFVFGLQKLLSLREFEEKAAKTDLGRAIAEADQIKRALEGIAAERLRIQKSRNVSMDLNALIAAERYINRLNLQKDELLEDLAAAELLIEQKRLIFAEAMKNRKVLTKLKEKRQADWRKANTKAEESAVEDAAYSRRVPSLTGTKTASI